MDDDLAVFLSGKFADSALGLDWPAKPGSLKENQRQQHGEGRELEPPRVYSVDQRGTQHHARREADDGRQDPAPYVRDARPIDPEDVRVQGQLNPDECRVEDPIGVEEQGYRRGDRGEPVAQRAVDRRGEQCREDQN